jgi:hypothetical protein
VDRSFSPLDFMEIIKACKDYIILSMIIDVITETSIYMEVISDKQKILN